MARQIVVRKGEGAVSTPAEADRHDSLCHWLEAYFHVEAATADSSRRVQRRDLETFLRFFVREEGSDQRPRWTPRLSRAFVEALRTEFTAAGARRYADRSLNRMLAHLKTFASWIHQHRPFPLGHPTARLPALPTTTLLIDERALTPQERRRLLDAADLLPLVGGRSKDRHRHPDAAARPVRQGYRPWRNRALVYLLTETGMRRAGAVNADLAGLDRKAATITTREKGGGRHTYKISREGLAALIAYLEQERAGDEAHLPSPALFLPAAGNARSGGRLAPHTVNRIWNEVASLAGIAGRTPHSARHAMGRHIVQKTGNLAAVQRQLGHKRLDYSAQYARISAAELQDVLDQR